ncbi:MAG: hypothetical protein K9N11_03760 [Lentisphaeria bacterium]|nr:hypothetical protein [Candidatus Neomarinimicrobiota bacterium]MCF7841950.1 hypothetical protein [Lentisphaeria bacterium]
MANTIPRKPEETLALLDQMINGVEKNRADLGTYADELLKRFVPIRDNLRAAIQKRTETAGLARQATQVINDNQNPRPMICIFPGSLRKIFFR